MNKNKISFLALALTSSSLFAGSMGMAPSEKLFILEGGVSYSHTFYKNNVVFPESYTAVTPTGFSINPSSFYPNDYFGGYAGLSFYFPDWLLNARYNLYGSERKANNRAGTIIKLAPAKLTFTADKVWGNINQLSYGLGGGAVIETVNKGYAQVALSTDNPPSESLAGRTHTAPLVEGFVMYRFANNFGTKFNVEYQIPTNNAFARGDLNLNLGINYAFPV